MTEQPNYVVQPLGKYGRAYLLTKRSYGFYRGLFAILYIALSIMFVLVVAPESFRVTYGISSNQIVIGGVIVAALGMIVLMKIASTGKIVFGQTEKRQPEISFMWNVRHIIGLTCASLFTFFLGAAFLIELLLQHTVDPKLGVACLVFSGFTWVIWNKKARNRK